MSKMRPGEADELMQAHQIITGEGWREGGDRMIKEIPGALGQYVKEELSRRIPGVEIGNIMDLEEGFNHEKALERYEREKVKEPWKTPPEPPGNTMIFASPEALEQAINSYKTVNPSKTHPQKPSPPSP